MTHTRIVMAAAAAFALLTHTSSAHEGAVGIVKERMDAMTEAGKAMKEAGERIRANRDLAGIKDDAEIVAAMAARIGRQFPPGSDQRPTDARPEIWAHWVDFSERAWTLERESAALATAADTGDPGAVGKQFRTVARACSDCHDQYRVKR
jgi:cytochrome c556